MKFRFCGELDCPDWILAEISTLSKMTSIKLKLFCSEVMKYLITGKLDYEKVVKLTKDAKYNVGDLKASIAAINFIYSNSGKYSVESETLSNELQQLGLPKELSKSVEKVYGDKFEELRQSLKNSSLRISSLELVHWRVDYVFSSSLMEDLMKPEALISLKSNSVISGSSTTSFAASDDKFKILLKEMKDAYKCMEELT